MKRLAILFTMFLLALASMAQSDMQLLQKWLNGVTDFDNEYPREKVVLHTDQQAYVEGETMWIKAFVVRASTLKPQPVSRVLYVELLNTEGQTMERQILRIDSLGQANGYIDLEDPIHNGFYELRAYTREMLNWGPDALFSQVVPVFDKELGIDLPDLQKKKQENRPAVPFSAGALRNENLNGSHLLTAGDGIDVKQLCALVVTCRERPCYIDTLTIGGDAGIVQLEIDDAVLHEGWNRCDLMTTTGNTLGETWLWKAPVIDRNLHVTLRQNKAAYQPFDPVAIEVEVSTADGKPASGVQFSMAVCDKEGQFLCPRNADLDSLLMSDHGGSSNKFSVMTRAEDFTLLQPIEEKLLLNGQVFRDNDKRTPLPHLNLFVNMYSLSGSSMYGEARTDKEGRFAFESNEDFAGEWIASFSVKDDEGSRKWSRVALNRWMDVPQREWKATDLDFQRLSSLRQNEVLNAPQLFQWEDTIPRIPGTIALAEATVKGKGKYAGLKGDRFSFRGGERRGMHYADKYVNVIQELERWRDNGGGNDLIQYFLPAIDKDFEYYTRHRDDTALVTDESDGLQFYYKGRKAYTFIDNELLSTAPGGSSSAMKTSLINLQDGYWADEVKSVVVMEHFQNWSKFLSSEERTQIDAMRLAGGEHIDDAIFIYTRPNHYLYRSKKGVDKRVISGFQVPRAYPAPSYNGLIPNDPEDFRRTLYWAPALTTDKEGKASVVFFNGARPDTELIFSLRGITPDGHIINLNLP